MSDARVCEMVAGIGLLTLDGYKQGIIQLNEC